jgi:hypothetical protein
MQSSKLTTIMKLLFQWTSRYCRPPRWMAFAYYSAERNEMLFVAYPCNYLVGIAWWLQDKWSAHALAESWIEAEIKRRTNDERNSWHNVKEHATLSAGASVDRGVEVETTENHVNRAADRGCCVSSCWASCIQSKAFLVSSGRVPREIVTPKSL